MIKLITGKKGTGKTKILIDQINDAVKATAGNVVCVEKGSTVRYSISRKVRWCDTERFSIEGIDAFYGFVAGMLAGHYDIKDVFVDGIYSSSFMLGSFIIASIFKIILRKYNKFFEIKRQ